MKRSEINAALKELEAMVNEYKFALPPFCHFTPEEWQEKGHEYDEVRDCMLGWDITDFGQGDFNKCGFSLIYHEFSRNGDDTIAPSSNFIYDFYSYKFMVQDGWEEVLSHDAEGNVLSGSAAALDEASNKGYEIKVAIKGICNGLWGEENQLEHEMFIKTGPHYYYDQTGYRCVV